jgi:hypothetical protein
MMNHSKLRLLIGIHAFLLIAPWISGEEQATEKDARLDPAALSEAIEEGVEWLVENQFDDGGWGSHHSPRPIEVFCTVPGSHNAFRVATSALCVLALEDSPYKTEGSRQAASRGIDYLIEAYDVKRVSGLEHYSVWAFGYATHALGRWLLDHPDDPRDAKIRDACNTLRVKLERYQSLDGGWGYLSIVGLKTYQPAASSMSFTTAACLVGVDRAKKAGIEFSDKMIRKAVDSIARCETPTGSFTYGEMWRWAPASGINEIKGSLCRTSSCQYAMGLFGKEHSVTKRRKAIEDLLLTHIRFPKIGVRRPIPHEAWYAISGYFYLFGMAYSAYVLEELPERDQHRFAKPLFDAVMYCHQPDGSFWDYTLYNYHKSYGTAYALIALSRIRIPEEKAEQ